MVQYSIMAVPDCGLTWFNSYLESLTDDDKPKVIENESHTVFKFGDGDHLIH